MSPAGAPSAGGSMRIDLERAPQAITELEAARDELVAIRKDALKLGKIDAGSRDSVSMEAAARLSATAVGGPGSFVDAINAGLAQMESLIHAMRAELDSYGRTESANEATLGS